MTRIIGLMPVDLSNNLVFYKRRASVFEIASQNDVENAKDLIILVPATDVGIHSVNLPTRNESEARRAAPYAIEDDLAVPAEDVHIALGPKGSNGNQRELHVCAPVVMQRWMERLGKNKALRNAKLVADASVIPSGNIALDLGDRIIAGRQAKRFALDADLPIDAIRAVLSPSNGNLKIHGEHLAARLSAPFEGEHDPLQTLLAWAHDAEGLIDLCQGKFAIRRSSGIQWANWRMPAGLAAAASVAWLSTIALENRALGQLTDQLNTTSRSIYSKAFPGEPVPRNLIQAVRSSASAGLSLDFRTASALLYSGVEAVGGPGIQSLRYDASGGTLRARISYENFGDELKLKAHLEEAGARVRIGEMRQQGGRVSGEITMELAK